MDWSVGTGTFYVTVKPTISDGWLVISPNNSTTREIVRYTTTGTDANGDYIGVTVRGVGGTTEQTHTVGEPIRMNITAEYWDAMNDDIAAIIAAGVSNANTTTMGGNEEATAAEIDAGTQTGSTGAELFINPKLLNDAHNIPHAAPGTSGNILVSDGTDWNSTTLASITPIPAFQQMIPIDGMTSSLNWQGASSNQYGSVLILNTSLTNELFRYERDSLTGTYLMTHNVSSTAASPVACVTVLGNYVYLFADTGNTVICYRYDLATLANETAMTVPSLDTAGANYTVGSYTDGTYIYVTQNKAGNVTNKWSLSNTTFSAVSTAATSSLDVSLANMYDGTSVYVAPTNTGTIFTYYKLTNVDGSVKTTLTKKLTLWSDLGIGSFIVNIDTTRMYIGRLEATYDESAQVRGFISLYPITKP